MARETIRVGGHERTWGPIIRDGSVAHLGGEGGWVASRYDLSVDSRGGAGAWLSIAPDDSRDFEFKARMMAQEGEGNASIFFRQHGGGQSYYQFDLSCRWQAFVVSRTSPDGERVISAVNCALAPGREYEIELAMRGESITSYLNESPMNQVRDEAYAVGAICLTAWQSRVRFTEPRLRLY